MQTDPGRKSVSEADRGLARRVGGNASPTRLKKREFKKRKKETRIMLALAGTIQGDTIIIENDNINNYDGKEVILTILDHPYRKRKKD